MEAVDVLNAEQFMERPDINVYYCDILIFNSIGVLNSSILKNLIF